MTSQTTSCGRAGGWRGLGVGLLVVFVVVVVWGCVVSSVFAVVPVGGLSVHLFEPLPELSEARNS
jgi:hypothetical protein